MTAINKEGNNGSGEESKIYSPEVIPYNAVDSEQMYIHKLQVSINEVQKIKEMAVMNENYGLADQTRYKLSALQVQLTKMEHQLNADMLTNCIGHWQNKLAEGLAQKMESINSIQSSGITNAYPLRENFHISLLLTLDRIPNNYIDSLIKAVLIILPHSSNDIQKSPYGFDFFLRKVQNFSKKKYRNES